MMGELPDLDVRAVFAEVAKEADLSQLGDMATIILRTLAARIEAEYAVEADQLKDAALTVEGVVKMVVPADE